MSYDYDLIVFGAGPAGEKAAVQAAYFGKRVAIIERFDEPGGAAVHTGTLPSKTLRETAIFLSGYRQSELYGLSVSVNRELAAPKLLSRKNAIRELEVSRIRWNLERHSVNYMKGMARFVDPHTIEVVSLGASPLRITAANVFIATGSKPFRPDDIPFDDDDIDDSDTILILDRLPKRMVVVGGGVIGSEYACMFAALHVEVTLIEGRNRMLPFIDNEMGERLRASMNSLGIDVRLGAVLEKNSVRRDGDVLRMNLASGETLETDKLLVASGRSGRTDDLGLENVGLAPDKRGYLAVNEHYQTAVPHIYAIGDCIGFPALASTSMEQGRIASCHAFELAYKGQLSELIPFGIYTIPELSSVGLSEETAIEKKIPYVVGRAFYRDNARGKIVGDKDGVLKLLFHAQERRLLGCHCIGDRASELVHVGQAVLTLGGTVDTFIEMVFNYPTLGEMFKYAAYDALGKFGERASVIP